MVYPYTLVYEENVMIFQWLKHKSLRRQAAEGLYQAALRQSRCPDFYTQLGVPDTTDGHFNLLCLHIALFIDRLNEGGRDGRAQGQALFDAMFRRMELDLREMGVGDLGVPKHMKRMMKAFNGRAHAYRNAMISGDDAALCDAIARNVYHLDGAQGENADVVAMAGYVRTMRQMLQSSTMDDCISAKLSFPAITPVQGIQKRSA